MRAQKNDPDGGTAYTNRVVTLAALFLGAVTVVLVDDIDAGLALSRAADSTASAAS